MIGRLAVFVCTVSILVIATDVSIAQNPSEAIRTNESSGEQNRIAETLLEELTQIGSGKYDSENEIDLLAAAAKRPDLPVEHLLKAFVQDVDPNSDFLVAFHALYALRLRGEGDEYYWNIIKAGEAHEYVIGFAVHILALDWEDFDAQERAFVRAKYPGNYFANRAIATIDAKEQLQQRYANGDVSREKVLSLILDHLYTIYIDIGLRHPASGLSVETAWYKRKLRELSEESPHSVAKFVLDYAAPRHVVGEKPMTWNQYVAECLSKETNDLVEKMRAERATDKEEDQEIE